MNAIVTLPPAVLQTRPHSKMSERYVHVNTQDVINLLAEDGFAVAKVEVAKTRGRDPLFTRHSVDLRMPGMNPIADKRGGYVPRMIFENSHDGTSAAKIMMGVYAFICSNGLVIGSTYAQERVRHQGESAQTFVDRIRALAKNTTPLFNQIEQWSNKQLSNGQAREFARLASVLRWEDPHRYDATEVLNVRRAEDDAGDLWTVFNRVQENTVRGGLTGVSRSGRAATSRPLSEIAATNDYNARLWKLAEEFATI